MAWRFLKSDDKIKFEEKIINRTIKLKSVNVKMEDFKERIKQLAHYY